MIKWLAKTKGQLERLNPKLILTDSDIGLKVEHEVYGFVIELTPDDEDPVAMVREILAELSEQHNAI